MRYLVHPVGAAQSIADRLLWAIDYFWSGAWRWQLSYRITESKAHQLSEDSIQARYELDMRALVVEGQVEVFACRFWGKTTPLVRSVVKASLKAGVPLCDLRLLVLCKEIQQVGNFAYVTRTPFIRLLGWVTLVALPLYVLHWLGLMQQVVAAPGPQWAKLALGLLLSAIYFVIWRGLSLYLYRANRARVRSGPKVAEIARRQWVRPGEVVTLGGLRD